MTGGIDCRLASPERKVNDNGTITLTYLRLGEPLVVRVQLRNRSGLDKSVPAEFVLNDPKKTPALHVGIQPRLFHAKVKDGVSRDFEEHLDWRELTPKITARFRPAAPAKIAAPGETFAEFQFDLNHWFDIRQAGPYRVQLVFTNPDGGLAVGSSQEIRFHVVEAHK